MKESKKIITIVTPTYNRANEIKKLYKSLILQTSNNFKWLIIDDGSTDETSEKIKNFKNNKFEILYKYKENGGKHTALNYAFSVIDTELFIIVDSDDYLEDNAIKQIETDWEKYKNDTNICGIVYARKYANGRFISDHFKQKEFISNYNTYVINNKLKGDKAEVFRTEVVSKYRFPEYEHEKFVGEGVLWSIIGHKYDMVFIDKAFYICEYLDGGLTKSGRRMRMENPYGGMYHAYEYMDKKYNFSIREKNALLYNIYMFCAKKTIKEIIKENKKYRKIIIYNLLPSYIIYIYWEIIYCKRG